ncbi:hypothetical protein GCM10022220_71830 [Actinocatenispora rupis]|uniref:Uncharacterized protein n=1 Tax=Actinocatenispora rupis TaxID=519421 RepID=A0A8J3NEE6_9ACTN|nr:hypothetical protein Aru02nite_71680 [Actinocatenispora rupis]
MPRTPHLLPLTESLSCEVCRKKVSPGQQVVAPDGHGPQNDVGPASAAGLREQLGLVVGHRLVVCAVLDQEQQDPGPEA